MYDGGVITREDIFSNEALTVGSEYAKNLEQAIKANAQFIDSIKEINKLATSIRQVKSTSEYVKIKEKEKQLIEESNIVWREQDALEKKLISTLKQKELATESTNRELMKQRLELQETNKQIKQEILERSGQIGQYKKLEMALNEVRNRAKNLKTEMFLLEQQGKKNGKEYRSLEIRAKALTLETNILDKGIKDIDKSLGQHQREVGNYAIAADALSPIFGRINSQLSIFGSSIETLANAKSPFKQLGADIIDFGKATIAFMLTPLGAVLTVLGGLYALISSNKQTVIDFNSGLINVGKTTGLADEALTDFGDNIISLSKKLKVIGTPALLEYATVAGQLGVKGTKNLLAFTEALAKLETATNIKGEEGGADIARLLTLTDGGVQNVKDFGDEIVNLGNNFAATEKEILSNATAISQNTGVYKLGRQAVLAYGTATKAVGLEAEIVGTAIGETLGVLEKSIRTGANVERIAMLTGKSVEELKRQFKTDSSSVLFDFVSGLNAVDEAGGSVIQQLEDLGIKQVRYKRVLASLATGGYDTLAGSIDTVRKSNGSLDEEFEAASNKLELHISSVKISWDNFILSIEDGKGPLSEFTISFLQFTNKAIDGLTRLSLSWGELWGQAKDKGFDAGTEEADKFIKNLENSSEKQSKINDTLREKLKDQKKLEKEIEDLKQKEFEISTGSLWDKMTNKGVYWYRKEIEEKQILLGQLQGVNKRLQDENIKNALKASGFDENTNEEVVTDSTLTDKQKREAERLRKQREKEEDERIKKLKDSYDKQISLEIFRAKRISDISKELSLDEKSTMDDRLIAFEKYHAELFKTRKLEFEKEFTLVSNFNKETKALTNEEIQSYLDSNTSIEGLTDEQKLILEKWYAEKDKLNTDYLKSLEVNTKREADIIAKQIGDDIKSSTSKNKKGEEEEISKLDIGSSLEDVEKYNKAVYEIKRKYRLLDLKDQLAAYDKQIESDKNKGIINQDILDKRMSLGAQIREFENESHVESLEKAKELEDKYKEIGENLKNALVDLTNAIFDSRIQRIDEDIEKTNRQYENEINLAQGNEQLQSRLRIKQQAEIEKLEAKKRKEQQKQAIFNKAMTAMDIGMNTASAIIGLWAKPGFPGAIPLTAMVGALGAVQLATVLATPIPKYEFGTRGGKHKGGPAEVAEKRPEVILEPNRDPYIIDKRGVYDLPRGTEVISSIDEYKRLQKASIMTSLALEKNDLDTYQSNMIFDNIYGSKTVDELRLMREDIKRLAGKKQSVNVRNDINIGNEIWKLGNVKW